MSESRFEAVRMGWRQDKDGYVLLLRVHPSDIDPELMADPLGQRYYTVVRRVDENEEPVSPKVKTKGEKMVQIAGILCDTEEFQKWMVDQGHALEATPKDAAEGLRVLLGITTRADLKTNEAAQHIFQQILKEGGF